MLKNAYFLEINCKNRLSVGSSAPKTPVCLRRERCYFRLRLQLCWECF